MPVAVRALGFVNAGQLANVAESEAKGLGIADKSDAFQIGIAINAIARVCSRRRAQEFLAFVETKGLNGSPGSLGKLANAHGEQVYRNGAKRCLSLVSKKLMYQEGVMRDTWGFIEFSVYCC